MTPQTKKTFQVGVLTTLAAALVIFLLAEAKGALVMQREYQPTVQRLEETDRSLARDIGDVRDISIEVLCEVKPSAQKCRR